MAGWKITLSDGTTLENLGVNGNNFVSETEVTESTFAGKLSNVVIEAPEGEEDTSMAGEFENMVLEQIRHYDNLNGLDGYYFILRVPSDEEVEKLQLRGDVDWLLMMTEE